MPAPVLQFKRGNAGVAGTVPALRPGEPAISLNNFDFFIGIDTSVANNKFFGSHRYWGREDGTNSLRLKLVDKDGTNYIALKTPNTLAGIVTYILPGTQGTVSSVLTNDGNGNLTWASGSANPVFSGIATFSDATDNTLGNADTGAVQIDGGLGVNKNVTVGGNLNVQGYSEFVGVVTFRGGTINIGDNNTDNINVAGEFVSNLVPNTDDTYDLGIGTQRWRQINVSGAATVGSLVCNDGSIFTGSVQINNNLNVNGNITLGGTSIYHASESVTIRDKDIVLGVTTDVSLYPDTSTDNTANHGGIAVASTEGTPLIEMQAVGVNSLPNTYKQIMWVKEGTWSGLGTDAWIFNYGVGIGSTQVPNGVRLAAGGVQITDTAVTATTFNGALNGNASSADQVKTVDTGNTNANYYVTFVNSNNVSATNETVYTDDGIYYNPGTNTFTTQYGYFTGNVTVEGSITGTATTATRATTIDTTPTINNGTYWVPFIDTLSGQQGETLYVGSGLSLNPSTGNVGVASVLSVGNITDVNAFIKAGGGSNALYLYSNGDVSFQAKAIVNEIRSSTDSNTLITLSGLDATFAQNVNITGITTVGSELIVGGDVRINGNDIKASDGNTNITLTSNTLTTFAGDIKVTGNDIQASDGNTNITLTSNTLTAFAGDIKVGGNDIQASDGNTNITMTSNTLTEVKGDLQVTGNNIKSSTGATAITLSANDVQIADDLTVNGNLYVNGNTTQVNTTSITVEDRTIELGIVDGSAPSSTTTWDLGVLFNYFDGSAKKSALVWEQGDARFKLGSVVSDGGGTGNNSPQLTVSTFAPIEVAELWVNNTCTGSAQQVIGCIGSELNLQNIVVDAGTF